MSEEILDNEMNYSPAYPGYVLQVGSSGNNVYIMQSYLNAIRNEMYPTMTKLVVDGKFGNNTKNTVMQYQAIKEVKIDGKIGPVTWNLIVNDYNNLPIPHGDVYPGFVLRPGMSNIYVDNMQSKLNTVSRIYPGVCHQAQDGKYGKNMSCSVRMFQMHFGLNSDGLIGEKTWNKIIELNYDVMHNIHPEIHTEYCGTVLCEGCSGDNVRMVQGMLNGIINFNKDVNWSHLKVDGMYGSSTKRAINEFQMWTGLKIDGKVGRETWKKLRYEFNRTL